MSDDNVVTFKSKADLDEEAKWKRTMELLERMDKYPPSSFTWEDSEIEVEMPEVEFSCPDESGPDLNGYGSIPFAAYTPDVRREMIRIANLKKE
jgi:hypothetical protein